MDTRSKILTLAGAAELRGEIVVVTGTFEILQVEHARQLAEVRKRTPAAKLLAVVLPSGSRALSQHARAEMAAALRMVDYVVAANHEDVGSVVLALKPVEVVRLEAAHASLHAQLIEHVRRRQNS